MFSGDQPVLHALPNNDRRTSGRHAPSCTCGGGSRRSLIGSSCWIEHTVAEGERLDQTSASRYLGDPEQFWRIADANGAMQPDDLVQTPGRRLRITLPEGISGAPNA